MTVKIDLRRNNIRRMIKQILSVALLLMTTNPLAAQGLKDAVGKYCLIGAAINQWQSDG